MPIHLSKIVLLVVLSQTYGFIRSYQAVNNVLRFSKAESIAWEEVFPEATLKTFCLPEHRPLGCTVEESLADLELKPVFISKVADGGFAGKSGLQVGDVIIGVSGVFGGLRNVLGKGIEEITSTVAGIPDREVLELQILRGTKVMEQHDSALVDICASIGKDEKEIEECVVSFLSSAFAEDQEDFNDIGENAPDTDSILDDAFQTLWGSESMELNVAPVSDTNLPSKEISAKSSKPLPWRSRSSPSGTFVRDPKTGKLRNIDD